MHLKKAMITAIAVIAVCGLSAQTASAKSIRVTAAYGFSGLCVPAQSEISYRLTFSAAVKVSGVAKPRSVRISYQIIDRTSGFTLRSGTTTLQRKRGYKGAKTPRFTASASHVLNYKLKMSYKAFGRTLKSSKTFVDPIPTADDINYSGLPAC